MGAMGLYGIKQGADKKSATNRDSSKCCESFVSYFLVGDMRLLAKKLQAGLRLS